MRHRALAVFLAVTAVACFDGSSCFTQSVDIGAPSPVETPEPSPSPSASPSASPGLVVPHHVRVGIYTQACQPGVIRPNNGTGQIPLGCVATVTATPKHADGRDLTPAEHGQAVLWSLPEPSGIVRTEPQPPKQGEPANPYNQDVYPLAVGTFERYCATVQGVTGCMSGSVVP